MSDIMKAGFLAAWVEFHTRRKVVLTIEDVLARCQKPGELDYYYRIARYQHGN